MDISYLGIKMAETFAVALAVSLLAPALTMGGFAPTLAVSSLTPALGMAVALLSLKGLSARNADNCSVNSSLEHFYGDF